MQSDNRPPVPDQLRHAAIRWNAPLSDAHPSQLLDELESWRPRGWLADYLIYLRVIGHFPGI
jgi:hypothetical protein